MLAALAVSFVFGLELQFAGRLGFYEDDFTKAIEALSADSLPGGYWRWAAYRVLSDEPLFNLYHALRFHFLGLESAWPYHVVAGLAQVLNGPLLFQFVRRLTGEPGPAWATLLIFCSFPGLGQALFWTAAIYVPLLTLLLAGLHCWLSWLRTGAGSMLTTASVCYFAAVFTHEAAFGFLGIFAATLVWESDDPVRDRRWRRLAVLAAANAAYVVVRETDWFGWSEFTRAAQRPVSFSPFAGLAFASVNLNFGPWLWVRISEFLAHATTSDWVRAGAAGLATAAFPALALRPRESSVKRTLLWYLSAAAAVVGVGFVLGVSLGQEVISVGVLVVGGWALLREGQFKLLLFGAAWFFSAFAPTYLYYIAFRHSYLPAVGAAMVLAVLFRAVGTLPFRQAHAVSWGLVGVAAAWWHLACLGEKNQWVGYAGDLRSIEEQVRTLEPPPRADQHVVLLGVAAVRDGNPIFDPWTLGKTIPFWLDLPTLRASSYLEAQPEGFRAEPGGELKPYDTLRLLHYEDGVLNEQRRVELPDGHKIELPAARRAPGS